MKRAVFPLFLILSMIASLLPPRASAQTIPNWAVGVSYSVGSLVMYPGVQYEALQANVSETALASSCINISIQGTMGFPAYGAGRTGGLNSTNCGEYQNSTQVSPVPNANGVGLCST